MWKEMAAQGWLGLHLPEEDGGQGFGLFELAVVLEETGRALVPGPLLPTVATSALVGEAADPAGRARFLPGLIDGSDPGRPLVGGVRPRHHRPGRRRVAHRLGDPAPVARCGDRLGGAGPGPGGRGRAGLVPARGGRAGRRRCGPIPRRASIPPVGWGRSRWRRPPCPPVAQLASLTTERVRDLAACLMAAEHAGGARWCLETATEYAKVRRPVRPAHRAVPGGQAPAGRPGHPGGADDRGGLGRGPGRGGRRRRAEHGAGRGHRRRGDPRRLHHGGQGVPPAPRGDRLHLGARPPPAPQAGDGRPPAARGARRLLRRGGRSGRGRGPAGPGRGPARRGRDGAGGAGSGGGRGGRRPRTAGGAGPWSTPDWSCPTGRARGAGTPGPSSRWSSTRRWPRPASSAPTSASGPGPSPRSSPRARPSSRPAWSSPP